MTSRIPASLSGVRKTYELAGLPLRTNNYSVLQKCYQFFVDFRKKNKNKTITVICSVALASFFAGRHHYREQQQQQQQQQQQRRRRRRRRQHDDIITIIIIIEGNQYNLISSLTRSSVLLPLETTGPSESPSFSTRMQRWRTSRGRYKDLYKRQHSSDLLSICPH